MYCWHLMRACALTMPDLDRLARAAIAGAITRALSAAIIASEQSRLGQSVGRSRSVGGLPKRDEAHVPAMQIQFGHALCYFQQAIDLDPRLGPSYCAWAWAQMMAASIYQGVVGRRCSSRAGVLGEREPARQPPAPAQPFVRRIAHEVGRNLQCRRGCLTPCARAPGTPTVRNG